LIRKSNQWKEHEVGQRELERASCGSRRGKQEGVSAEGDRRGKRAGGEEQRDIVCKDHVKQRDGSGR
jgi:hypothetical protein